MVPDTVWTFFTLIWCKIFIYEKTKNKRKRGRWPIFPKNMTRWGQKTKVIRFNNKNLSVWHWSVIAHKCRKAVWPDWMPAWAPSRHLTCLHSDLQTQKCLWLNFQSGQVKPVVKVSGFESPSFSGLLLRNK